MPVIAGSVESDPSSVTEISRLEALVATTTLTMPPGRRDRLCVTALVTSSEVSKRASSARG